MKQKLDLENIRRITEKLKLAVLNEPEMDVRIAVDKLKDLIRRPEFWASDWKDKE